jgi:hypothetical protein
MKRSPMPRKRSTPRRTGKPTPRIKAGRVEDPAHLARVRALPCVICGATPCEPHHPKGLEFCGKSQKASDHDAFPLCPACHRTGPNAFHAIGKRPWEALYGPQRDFAFWTRATLGREAA